MNIDLKPRVPALRKRYQSKKTTQITDRAFWTEHFLKWAARTASARTGFDHAPMAIPTEDPSCVFAWATKRLTCS